MSFSLLDIVRTDFRTTKSADEINSRFQNHLGLPHRYGPARLAIARSLAIASAPDRRPFSEEEPGKAIKGENLFGVDADMATWVALVTEHADKEVMSRDEFRELVAAHWHRGVNALWEEWKTCGPDNDPRRLDNFLLSLLERTGLTPPGRSGSSGGTDLHGIDKSGNLGPIDLSIGNPGIDLNSQEKLSWRINGRGNSPHVAVMGANSTGKTRLAMDLVREIQHASGCSVLLFDMGKGDIAGNSELVAALNCKVISSPNESVPLDVLRIADQSDATVNNAALTFRESFARAAQSRPGGVQLDALRDAATRVLKRKARLNLSDVRDSLREVYAEAGRREDVVTSTFNDFCIFKLFSPDLTPAEFFSKSWVIDVHTAPETVQRLVVFMILDAANTYFKQLQDSPIDSDGNRKLRLTLVIDEARKVLGYSQPSLIDLVRTSRSKGMSVMLISQGPDDFAQEEENFLENIGLAVCFRTNAKSAALRAVLGQKVDLAGLPNGVCVTRLPNRPGVSRILAWT